MYERDHLHLQALFRPFHFFQVPAILRTIEESIRHGHLDKDKNELCSPVHMAKNKGGAALIKPY